jgi:hypothetical protein
MSINIENMNYKYSKDRNTVKVCKNDTCIEAKGKNADLLAGAVAVMLVFVGIAAIASVSR